MSTRFRRFLKIAGLTLLGGTLLCAAGVASMLILPSEARALRDEVIRAEGLSTHTKFQISLGACTLGATRLIVSQIDKVEPEAREALRAVEGVAVGVYSVEESSARSSDFGNLDSRMEARGWKRFLCVREQGKTVIGYMPAKVGETKLPLCMAIHDGDKLIIVSVKADQRPIVELARGHLPQTGLKI